MQRKIQVGPVVIDEGVLGILCRRYSVRELSIFGSAAHGGMRPDSDIDLLVEFLPDVEVGLLENAGLMQDLSELLGRKVDLVSKRGLRPLIRDSILQEALPVHAEWWGFSGIWLHPSQHVRTKNALRATDG